MTHISEDRYREEVEQQAKYAVEEIDSAEPEHLQREQLEADLPHSLHGHNWFTQYAELTFYAEIIEHADADPESHRDPSTLLDAPSVADALENVAYAAFKDDVRNAALEKIERRTTL